MDSLKVLIVEPDGVARQNLSKVFEELGYEVTAPDSFEGCTGAAHEETFQVIAMVHTREFRVHVSYTPLDLLRSTEKDTVKILSLDSTFEVAHKLSENGYNVVNLEQILNKGNLTELKKQITSIFRSRNIEKKY